MLATWTVSTRYSSFMFSTRVLTYLPVCIFQYGISVLLYISCILLNDDPVFWSQPASVSSDTPFHKFFIFTFSCCKTWLSCDLVWKCIANWLSSVQICGIQNVYLALLHALSGLLLSLVRKFPTFINDPLQFGFRLLLQLFKKCWVLPTIRK